MDREFVGFEGEFFAVQGGLPTTPRRRPYPRLYAASRSGPGKDTIARHCDVWFVAYKPGPETVRRTWPVSLATLPMTQLARSYGREIAFRSERA